MRIGNYRLSGNWGLVGFTAGLFAFGCIYFADAYRSSNNIQNLLLVAPAAALAAVLFVVIVVREVRLEPLTDAAPTPRRGWTRSRAEVLRTPALMAAVGVYLAGISYVGFDISTFLFIGGALAIQGERRPLLLVGYSAVFAVLVVLGMKALLPFPMPNLFL